MPEEILQISSLSKTYGGVRALSDVELTIRAGEVHALMGHNGSGKSTLIKCLSGYVKPDDGAVLHWHGELANSVDLRTVGQHGKAGVRFVHQQLALVNQLSTVENLALRQTPSRTRWGTVDMRALRVEAQELLDQFGVNIAVDDRLADVSPVDRVIVAIAASLRNWSPEGGLLVLDEPTSVLPKGEVDHLFEIVRRLRERGASVLYVSHRLDEIFEMADRVTVLREGKLAGVREVAELDKDALVRLMLGEEVQSEYVAERTHDAPKAALLELSNLRGQYLTDASLTLYEGDVLGVAGLPGDGRDEFSQILGAGVPYPVEGSIVDHSDGAARSTPLSAWRKSGVAFVPPDRSAGGVISKMSVRENLTLSILNRFGRGGLKLRKEKATAHQWISALGVRTANADEPISSLSGGNQQKVLIGRALLQDPKLLILQEPTAGVDIGARHEIYQLIAERVATGLSVLVTSTDIDDLLGLCTRVALVHDGRVVGIIPSDQLDEFKLAKAMEGLDYDSINQ
jgi:ribose transport system ATP-binding protein